MRGPDGGRDGGPRYGGPDGGAGPERWATASGQRNRPAARLRECPDRSSADDADRIRRHPDQPAAGVRGHSRARTDADVGRTGRCWRLARRARRCSIFSPAHRRLRTLEQAARALGEGRTDVRAVEGGGDEVSALAHTFNRMADDLGARAAALAASDRARRQLLADVSHELMTPLAAVRGYTETLAMPELSLDASTRNRYLGIIGDETQKLESLIGDLLDLARLEGGGGTLTMEEVPVKELFGRIADRHGPAIRERRITPRRQRCSHRS